MEEYRRNKRPTHIQHILGNRLLVIAQLAATTISLPYSHFSWIFSRLNYRFINPTVAPHQRWVAHHIRVFESVAEWFFRAVYQAFSGKVFWRGGIWLACSLLSRLTHLGCRHRPGSTYVDVHWGWNRQIEASPTRTKGYKGVGLQRGRIYFVQTVVRQWEINS